MPCLPQGLCPNCGQTSCWRLDCCNFPRQGRPISQVPSSQSLGFPGPGDQRLIFPWDLSPQCSHRRPWEPPRIRVAGKWVTLADTEGVWFNTPCYNFLSQMPNGVGFQAPAPSHCKWNSLVYRKVINTDFCMLVWYPATCLKLFIIPKSFLVESLGSLMYTITSSANGDT